MRSKNMEITASEMSALWDSYINQTHNVCVLKYFASKAEDTDLQNILNTALQKETVLVDKGLDFLKKEGVPIPIGFTDRDVNEQAPRLFSDTFAFLHLKHLASAKLSITSLYFANATKKEIRTYFKQMYEDTTEVLEVVRDVMLEKGIYRRHPTIDPQKSDVIENKDYLSGNYFFQEDRYLNSIEISHVASNVQANTVGQALTKGYSQTADLKDVREYMKKANDLAGKVIVTLTDYLQKSDLSAPMGSGTEVYNTTEAPFSDRLMMYQMSVLTSAGITDYATSLATSMKSDLMKTYLDFLTDTSKLANKGAKLMIENHWLEQPPQQEKIE
ncbi:DUF3231 family protein [Evansella sp. AB-rgal1]|uniref:DUF3231 family protein n=1 Tax=Evansella sp. AB-rgal1 TaxID=3242696 RepID=UPI00359D9BAE